MKKVLFLILTLCSFPVHAQNMINPQKVTQVGVFDDWTSYIYEDKKEKVCFVSSSPIKSSGEYNRRGDAFLIISHRPKEELFDILTIVAGYTYMPRSEVAFRVGKYKATLFTSQDTAWSKNLRTDKEIAEAMNKGIRITVKGQSIEGVETYDTYSLKGFNNAMEAINRLCRQPVGN